MRAGGFQKGDPRVNRKGRPKGAKGVRNQQWEQLGKYLIDKGAKRFIQVLNKMPDDQFVDAYSRIVKYFKPQLRQVDATLTGGDKPLVIGFTDDKDEGQEDEQS